MWRILGRALVAALFGAVAVCAAAQAAERPPQFVLMAFDNCTELERWQELSAFAAEMNKVGSRLHFTFFVSGVNFIATAKRNLYEAPGQRRGASRIDFGGSADDVRRRVEYINSLYARGHEIGAHAVGHFSGRSWSAADWTREFRSFHDVLTGVASNNSLGNEVKFAFPVSKIVGFRAPYLDSSPGLYTVLKTIGYRYDTSSESPPNAWPDKIGGIWRFNLAELKLHGSSKHTLSMDYNFSVTQSHDVVDPKRHEFFKEQMLQTYLDYFRTNYTGNRAPLNIGHHFFDYQAGAYKEALMAFARAVCGLPEVKCVTYSALADFLDRQDAATLQAFQKGDFPHAAPPAISLAGLERQPSIRGN